MTPTLVGRRGYLVCCTVDVDVSEIRMLMSELMMANASFVFFWCLYYFYRLLVIHYVIFLYIYIIIRSYDIFIVIFFTRL